PLQIAAATAIRHRQFRKAIKTYYDSFRAKDEQRPWVLRSMVASMIQCQQAIGSHQDAAQNFISLLRDDQATPHFHVIPLAWASDHRMDPKPAEPWLSDDTEGVRLIGASYLLLTSKRDQAIRVLEKLIDSSDKKISALARAQLLRTTVLNVSDKHIERCQMAIDRLPEALRGGAYYVLGRLHSARDEHQQAAVAFMRVPILYWQHQNLAAESLLAAGRSLAKANQRNNALRVYQELINNYPESTAASEAKQRRETLIRDN
ncbi:MAG: tetratricopeptide repeat protein, partial [Planctomycetales bacterium]